MTAPRRMRLVCGQCGKQHEVEAGPQVLTAVCDACGHEIFLGHLTHPDQDEPYQPGVAFGDETQGFAESARKIIRERVLIQCGSCQARVKVSKRQCGQVIRCPSCGVDIRVPLLDTDDLFEDTYLPGGPTGELALVAALSTAEKRLARKAQAAQRSEGPSRKMLLVIGGGIAILLVLAAVIFMPGQSSDSQEDDAVTTAETVGPPSQPVASQPADAPPAAPTPQATVTPPPPPAAAPQPSDQPRAVVEEIAWADTIGEGRYPPALGMLYLRVRLRLHAAAEPVRVSFSAEDILLRLGSEMIPALGTPPAPGPLPRLPVRTTRYIQPGTTETLTVLFELPARQARGSCHIRGLARVAIELPDPGRVGHRLEGQWQEESPRNLKPLLRHPVMAAIQARPDDRLIIRRTGDAYVVWFDKAAMAGKLAFAGRGQYRVEFEKQGETLPAVLRLFDEGRRMVLYLRDEPMYQLTYRRVTPASAPASKPTAEPKASPTSSPASKPATRPARAPAQTRPAPSPQPEPLPENDPHRPRFFGV
jgi:DNA-directed RNA polymerase subunit RPC12/RpoP